MEDAHITISPLSDKKNSVFGIFDGHGGKYLLIQERRFQHLSSGILLRSSKRMRIIRRRIMRRP